MLTTVGHCGLSAVHLACVWARQDSIEVLFNAGANIADVDENGISARDVAIEHNNPHIADFIDDLSK